MPVSVRPRNCFLCGLEILLKGCSVLCACEKLVAFCGVELNELDLHLFYLLIVVISLCGFRRCPRADVVLFFVFWENYENHLAFLIDKVSNDFAASLVAVDDLAVAFVISAVLAHCV